MFLPVVVLCLVQQVEISDDKPEGPYLQEQMLAVCDMLDIGLEQQMFNKKADDDRWHPAAYISRNCAAGYPDKAMPKWFFLWFRWSLDHTSETELWPKVIYMFSDFLRHRAYVYYEPDAPWDVEAEIQVRAILLEHLRQRPVSTPILELMDEFYLTFEAEHTGSGDLSDQRQIIHDAMREALKDLLPLHEADLTTVMTTEALIAPLGTPDAVMRALQACISGTDIPDEEKQALVLGFLLTFAELQLQELPPLD